MKKIALASDHAGYEYKQLVRSYLENQSFEILDFGTDSDDSVDYPVYIKPAAQAVATEKVDLGIIFGGSGNGEAMVANKFPGIRCAVVWDLRSAELAKKHNNANMLSLGQRLIDKDQLLPIIQMWLDSVFEEGRHRKRIDMID
ncbi:MAG: RpiB/LacA/LacB family sugar-phosphate isomerase [Dehalococcoidia bacterium]